MTVTNGEVSEGDNEITLTLHVDLEGQQYDFPRHLALELVDVVQNAVRSYRISS